MSAAGAPGFPLPVGEITGRSVAPADFSPPPELWPRSLGDYLTDCVGKTVAVKYALPTGRYMQARGKLEAVGTNFLAVKSRSLLLVELGSIIAVEVV